LKTILLFAAAAENNALGINIDLLWHYLTIFKRFKKITLQDIPLLWGEKTLKFSKPLFFSQQKTYYHYRDKNYTNKDKTISRCFSGA